MPLVEFECNSCGERLERLVRATSEASPSPCPSCGGETRKIFSAFNAKSSSQGSFVNTGCGQACGSGGFT